MARYKVQGPDGVEHELEGPDGASDAEILAAAQDAFKSEPLTADAQGMAPTNASGNAAGTPQQQIDFERNGMVPGSTEPEEMRALRQVNEVGAGSGMTQMGLGIAKGAAGMAANVESAGGVRNAISQWLEKKAAEQFAKAGGVGSNAEAELGAEGVRNYGRYLRDKEIVTPWASEETMRGRVAPMLDKAGKEIGGYRDAADFRSIAQGAERPTIADMETEVRSRLGAKYGSGVEKGQAGSLENALEEMRKLAPVNKSTTGEEVSQTMANVGGGSDEAAYGATRALQEGPHPELYQDFPYLTDKPTFTELFDMSTGLNKAAKTEGQLLQHSEALTDTANVLARKSTEGMEPFISKAERAGYDVAKKDWGMLSTADDLLSGGEARAFANKNALPVSKFGALSRALNAAAPHSAIAGLSQKISTVLKTDPAAFGQYQQVLTAAAQRGIPALASTVFMLQQQDPEFRSYVEHINSGERETGE